MRGVFWYDKEIDQSALTGIDKKVLAQIDVFKRELKDCILVSANAKTNHFFNLLSLLPYMNLNPVWRYEKKFDDADYIYFRRPPYCTVHFIRILKKIKRRNSQAILIMEIPTYPYDSEFKKKRWFHLMKDCYNRKKYKRYINRIVTFSEHKSIWGIKTIRTQNGIELASIPVRKVENHQIDTIHMVAVAMFSLWHGYDRLIKGLQLYYSQPVSTIIVLDMVGDGPSLSEYKDLVNKLRLNRYVVFHGKLSGEKLDKIFDDADIAIASLGIHRINLKQVSTLKAREYCARGIPFIKAYEDADFDVDFDFALTVDASDNPIDIRKILFFYNDLMIQYGKENIVSLMREYAEKRLGWDTKMKSVVSYIRSHI